MIVAAYQFWPRYLDVRKNLETLGSALESCEADLVVFPELATTGYLFESREQLAEYAEASTGPTCDGLSDLSVRKRILLICGFAERAGDTFFNSALIATPDGRRQIYRKIHLFGREKTMFSPGDTPFPVTEFRGARIGTMICYDWRFPESVRTLALRGAQIVCHPSDLVALPRLWKPVMQTRSFENKVFTVTANRTGTETLQEISVTFHGSSQITDVNGKILAETDENGEGWITARIDPSRTLDKSFSPFNDIFLDRRPEMYELS